MNLRPYQIKGRKDIYEAWKHSDVIFFVLTTGGGKTFLFSEIIKEYLFNGKRAMLIAHREELINQAWKTMYEHKVYAGIIKADVKPNYDLQCQICSIQTIARRNNLPPTDLIVIDEGHHVTDKNTYNKILLQYPDAKVLIVSATPYRLSGEGFLNLLPNKQTHLIVNCTLKTLINDGWLVPFDYYIASIPDLSEAEKNLVKGEYSEDEAKKAMELAPIVESYMEHANGKQGIVFAVNVKHSLEICSQYWRAGIPCEHVDANTPADKRKQIIDDFKAGKIRMVSNVGIFTEGTDFPVCEVVQLAAPTKSLSKYLQMVGRSSRALPGIVDSFETADERKKAIAESAKPNAIVLDNAGCALQHMLPDHEHNWQSHFEGTKGKKKPVDDEEMLVYIAEDSAGNQIRTTRFKETEGMKLVKVTNEVRRKIVNLKSLKEFEKLFNMYGNIATFKRPGYKAVEVYIDFCTKHQFLMVPEIWDFMIRYANTNIDDKKQSIINANAVTAMPPHLLQKSLDKLNRMRVSKTWLTNKRTDYARQNADQLASYMVSNMDLSI